MGRNLGSINLRWGLVAALTAAILLPAVAAAHVERPSYWPDPRPDRSVKPATGGKVPKARSLGSAVTGKGPGKVRVVCKGSSLERARSELRWRPDAQRVVEGACR